MTANNLLRTLRRLISGLLFLIALSVITLAIIATILGDGNMGLINLFSRT